MEFVVEFGVNETVIASFSWPVYFFSEIAKYGVQTKLQLSLIAT